MPLEEEGDGEMIWVAYELVDVHVFPLACHRKLLHTTRMIDGVGDLSAQKEVGVEKFG